MESTEYAGLRVLIIDDFPNFRTALAKNMHTLGFRHINSVSSGSEALSICRKNHYDIIFSDYNLGNGKNGQQLLEEIRYLKLCKLSDLFVLISADTSRDVVMASYDCEPNDYLTKPITGKTLEQRIRRLLAKRQELSPVYTAIDDANLDKAIRLLEELLNANSRYSVDCQKLLGDLYLRQNKYELAEDLYKTVLSSRELDWAKVGLANVELAYGQYGIAASSLDVIIDDHPSYLKAYDSLSDACVSLGDNDRLQKVLEKAALVSPMSIGRQKTLADICLVNGDVASAIKAYKKTIKYGANSHYDNVDNHLNLARAITKIYDEDVDAASGATLDAIHLLNNIDAKYEVSDAQKIQATLLNSQINALNGNKKVSSDLFNQAQNLMSQAEERDVEIEVEHVNALIASGKNSEAKDIVDEMLIYYKNNQPALEKIDFLLEEPISIKGKKIIGTINKKGIDYYKSKDFEKSIEYFHKAQRKYPRYIGLKLNFVQALISSIKEDGYNKDYIEKTRSTFKVIERYVSPKNDKYPRYKQLNSMFHQAAQQAEYQERTRINKEKKHD